MLKCYVREIPLKDCVLDGDHNYSEKVGIDGCCVSTVHIFVLIAIRSQELLLEKVFRCIRVFVGPSIIYGVRMVRDLLD